MSPGIGAGIGIGPFHAGALPFYQQLLNYSPMLMLVAGVQCYTDAAKAVGCADTDAVYTWGNLGTLGATADAVQSTEARRPILSLANGVTYTQASTHWMDLAGLTGSGQSFTFVYVVTTTANGDASLIGAGGGTTSSDISGNVSVHDGTSEKTAMAALASATQVLSFVVDAGEPDISVYRDGVLLDVIAYDTTWNFTNVTLGALASAGGRFFDGVMKFAMVIEGALSDADLAAVHAILLAQYGLAFDATSVEGAILDLDASVGITSTGAGVSTWATQQGGTDAVQATDADRPLFEATGWSTGLPTVTFDVANTEEMDLTGLTDASHDYTLFCAMNQVSASAATTQVVLNSSSTGGMFLATRPTAGAKVAVYDGTAYTLIAPAATGEQLLTWTIDSGTPELEIYRDGVSLGTSAAYDATWAWSGPSIGGLGAFYLDAKVARMALYGRLLNAYEIAALNTYFVALYGL